MSIFVSRRDRFRAVAVASAATLATAFFTGCAGAGSVAPTGGASGVAPVQSVAVADSAIDFAKSGSYRSVVLGTKPIAYFPFESIKEGSLVGGFTTMLSGGAKISGGGAIKSQNDDRFLALANSAYATTSLSGGIPGTGSVVAWVKLASLPSVAGHDFYVAGESQIGNDFDVQFEAG